VSCLSALPPVPPSSPASGGIDLHRLLIPHPASTFLLRVSGDSMTGAGIRSGDLLIVDRSVEPRSGRIVVARLGDAFTLKRLVHRRGGWWLEAAHPAYPSLALGNALATARGPAGGTAAAHLWGVALHAIRRL